MVGYFTVVDYSIVFLGYYCPARWSLEYILDSSAMMLKQPKDIWLVAKK